jgi:hypothetical protein
MLNLENIPKELQSNNVCWNLEKDKNGRDSKIPYNPHTAKRASVTNSESWSDLPTAIACVEKYGFKGVGYVLTRNGGIIVVDLDDVLDENGNPDDIAKAILAEIFKRCGKTYIEVSPSGRGLHIFLKGTLPSGGKRKGCVELYDNQRYFTLTGIRWKDCADEIAVDNGAINWILDTYIRAKTKSNKSTVNRGRTCLSDSEILKIATTKDDTFSPLWSGQWEGRYNSQSEADMSLCGKLAFWSNCDSSQMERLFQQSGLMRDKWQGDYARETVNKACVNATKTYTKSVRTARKKRESTIFEQDGSYWLKRGDIVKQLTNFIIVQKELIRADSEAQLTCELINDVGKKRLICFLSEDFTNLVKFKRILNRNSISFSFFGTEGDLELLKQYLDSLDWVEKKGVKPLGICRHNGQNVFVTSDKAIAAGGVEVDGIIQLDKYRCLDTKILEYPLLKVDELGRLCEMLLTYNDPAKTVPILAWVAGCFIKWFLKREPIDAKFPLLFIIGEAGSGKSKTLEKVILAIFGRTKVSASSQMTLFTLMQESCSSNLIPQALDEFKPSKLTKTKTACLENHFRDTYDRHEGKRGKQDLSHNAYELFAPVVVVGEEGAEETAIRERTIELLFSRKDLKNQDYVMTFNRLKREKSLLGSFGRTLLETALQLDLKDVADWYSEGEKLYSEESFPARIADNLSCVYAGLKLVERLCNSYGHSWDYFFPFNFDMCAQQLSYSVRNYLLDGSTHNKSIIEETFEIMARMKLKYDVHYRLQTVGKHLVIAVGEVYDLYTKYRKDYAIIGECLSAKQFKKQLRNSDYCIIEKNERFGQKTHRSFTIDYEQLQAVCDVGGFMVNETDKGEAA